MYKVLIVDDEQLARKLLEGYVAKIPNLQLVAQCKNPLEAMSVMENEEIDLILLDIQMPELTGIEFIKTLHNKPEIILTTAYSEYALDSYELEVTDYLLKPFSFERFLKAVSKATDQIDLKRKGGEIIHEDDEQGYLSVKADHRIYKIRYKDIIYIEGLREYVTFNTHRQKVIALESLKRLEEKLPSKHFARIHKSFIVNTDEVDAIYGNMVEIGRKQLPIGKSYKEEVVKKIFPEHK